MGLREHPEKLIHDGRAPRYRETYRVEIEEVEGGVNASLMLEPFKAVKYTWIRGSKPDSSAKVLEFITAVLQDLDGAMVTYSLAVKDVEVREGEMPLSAARELVNKTFVEARKEEYLSVKTVRWTDAHLEMLRVDTLIVHCVRGVNDT